MSFDNFQRDFRHNYCFGDAELNERWDALLAAMHSACPIARSGRWLLGS